MMATLGIEDRKRPLDIESLNNPTSTAKRPHLDRANSSFTSNGTPGVKKEDLDTLGDDEESIPVYKGLEAFRKEAIYRQMRESKRDLQRSQERVGKLQEAMNAMNERCAAFNRFWDTLVEDVRLFVKDEDLTNQEKSSFLDSIPLTLRKPAIAVFSESIQERSISIKAMLSRIATIGPSSTPDVDQLRARCHRLGEESASLKSQLTLTINDKEGLNEELTLTIEKLKKVERKFDRMHSRTVKATERPGAEAEEEAEQAREEAANAEKEAALQRKARTEGELHLKNGIASEHTVNGGASSDELEEYRRLAETRLDESNRWRDEVLALRQSMEQLRTSMTESIDGRLLESQLYKDLHNHFEEAKQQQARVQSVNERIEAENAELRQKRIDFESNAKMEADSQVDGLRAGLKAHEADLARIRGQRDDLNASLAEKKQREAVRFTQIDEMKALVHSKEKRIVTLRREVWRLQYLLASRAGDEKMMERVRSRLAGIDAIGENEPDVDYIEALQDRLRAAEESSQDLKRQLDARSSSTSEEELGSKVASLQKELDKVTAILNLAANTSEDAISAEDLKSRITKQSEEMTRLERELVTSQQSTTALCDELDKIGEAYSESQKVATTRIIEVTRLEDKIMRLTAEKSKADQKYFSAMRNNESIENEVKVSMRNLERQTKVIDTFKELEKSFQVQMQEREVEITQLRGLIAKQNSEMLVIQRDCQSIKQREERSTAASIASKEEATRRVTDYLEESKGRQEVQEQCDKLQRELDKCKKQLAMSGVSSSKKKGSGSDDVQVEYLNSLLRCSACKDRYRDRIITRCLHTFCQDCVDARIQTRQRKCPHCGLGFSTSDVQTLYLQ